MKSIGKTWKIAGVYYALLKVQGIAGGYIGRGKTQGEAIIDAYNRYNWYRLTDRNKAQNENDFDSPLLA